MLLLVLIPFFAVPYVLVIVSSFEGAAIVRKWGEANLTTAKHISFRKGGSVQPVSNKNGPERLKSRWFRAIFVGIYFSVLSATRIGWRELTIGTWLERIQPRDFTLYATGWTRSIAGLQSLFSVYLIAMWALTYFGHPFE